MGIVANIEQRRKLYKKHHGFDAASDVTLDAWWRTRAQAVSSYDYASFSDTGGVPSWEVQTPLPTVTPEPAFTEEEIAEQGSTVPEDEDHRNIVVPDRTPDETDRALADETQTVEKLDAISQDVTPKPTPRKRAAKPIVKTSAQE